MIEEILQDPISQEYHVYLARTLDERKTAFFNQYRSVLEVPAADPVHDLRVSIRRLSAMLVLFDKLGHTNETAPIRLQLKRLMNPLGKLRDVQVRLEWIARFYPKPPAGPIGEQVSLLREQERQLIDALPPELGNAPVDEIERLSPERFLIPIEERSKTTLTPLTALSHREIIRLYNLLLKRAKRYKKTNKVEHLHRTRIALKKFRYTLEIFFPFYPSIKPQQLSFLQTMLGDIHDLDLMLVWLQLLSLGAGPNQLHHLHQFKKRIESDRIRRMKDIELIFGNDLPLFRKWSKKMNKRNSAAGLDKAKPEIVSFCQRFDPDPPHAQHVETLALQLFDQLGALSMHKLDQRYRTLLSYGCLLHDIGWVKGQRRHHKRAFKMIESSDLPLNKKDKNLVALIARFHRKAAPGGQVAFAKLPPTERVAVSQLAAIIRIADVLDRYHDQKASIVTVNLSEDALIIRVTEGSLLNIPEAALIKKSNYFPQIFGVPVMIVEKQKPAPRKSVSKSKTPAKKAPPAKKVTIRKPAVVKAKATTRKAVAKPKAPTKKAPPAKITAVRKPAVVKAKSTTRKAVAKPKTPAKKAAPAKKTAVRKPAVVKAKATTRKVVAKPKAPAKKAAPVKAATKAK